MDERGELLLEGVVGADGDLLDGDDLVVDEALWVGDGGWVNGGWVGCVGPLAKDEGLAVAVVDRDVGVALDDAELSDSASGDAAGGEVGDAAALKGQPGVRYVLVNRNGGHTNGVHRDDRGGDQVKQDIEVVDHEVKDDADVERAEGEWADAVAVNVKRGGEVCFGRDEGGVEAFDVSDLDGDAAAVGEGEQLVSLGEGAGEGFFDEDGAALFDEVASDGAVCGGWDGDACGVDVGDKVAVVGEVLGAVGGREAAGALGDDVGHADEPRLRDAGVEARVVAAEVSCADNGDAEGRRRISDF